MSRVSARTATLNLKHDLPWRPVLNSLPASPRLRPTRFTARSLRVTPGGWRGRAAAIGTGPNPGKKIDSSKMVEEFGNKSTSSSRSPYGSLNDKNIFIGKYRNGTQMRERYSINSRHLIGTLLGLCCIALGFVITLDRNSSPVAACDEATCMANSIPKPPGVIPGLPRVLEPDELQKLKDALKEEQALEQEANNFRYV